MVDRCVSSSGFQGIKYQKLNLNIEEQHSKKTPNQNPIFKKIKEQLQRMFT